MAKCFVDDTSLTEIAEAIRTKGGTTDQLVFPAGFISAIEAIGGGLTYEYTTMTLAEDMKSSNIGITIEHTLGKKPKFIFAFNNNFKSSKSYCLYDAFDCMAGQYCIYGYTRQAYSTGSDRIGATTMIKEADDILSGYFSGAVPTFYNITENAVSLRYAIAFAGDSLLFIIGA